MHVDYACQARAPFRGKAGNLASACLFDIQSTTVDHQGSMLQVVCSRSTVGLVQATGFDRAAQRTGMGLLGFLAGHITAHFCMFVLQQLCTASG